MIYQHMPNWQRLSRKDPRHSELNLILLSTRGAAPGWLVVAAKCDVEAVTFFANGEGPANTY